MNDGMTQGEGDKMDFYQAKALLLGKNVTTPLSHL
jgi:hypothetical protein